MSPSSCFNRAVLLIAVAAAPLTAQTARGSVSVGATVLPSPQAALDLGVSAATGYTMVAGASIVSSGTRTLKSSRKPVPAAKTAVAAPASDDYVEITVTTSVAANVASRIVVHARAGLAAADVMVRDLSGTFRPLVPGQALTVAAVAADSADRSAQITYRVSPAVARELAELPMHVTLQTSSMM